MKRTIAFILSLIFCISSVSAQNKDSERFKNAYNRAAIGYQIGFVNWNSSFGPFNGAVIYNIHGISLEYTYGLSIGKKWFTEFGGQVDYLQSNSTLGYYYNPEHSVYTRVSETPVFRDLVRLKIPVNFTYRYVVSDRFCVAPYAGLALVINPYANYERYEGDIKRVQGNAQVGLNFSYRRIVAGVEYGVDFTRLADKLFTSHIGIRLGYEF